MEYSGFVGPAYQVQSLAANCQRCVNMYVQPNEFQGKNKANLFNTPGFQKIADATPYGTGGIRGEYTASNDRFFAVVGASLIEIDSSLSIVGHYPLPNETGTGQVSMTDNGSDMFIATGPNAYWFHFADNGTIGSIAVTAPGTGYAVGDVFTIDGGTGGSGTVESIGVGGAVSTISLTTAGSGYGPAAATTTAVSPSVGTGLTVSITLLNANTVTQVTDAVFEGAVTCGFINGFIVFNQPNTQVFWITMLYSTVIDPLGFASAEGNPDNLVSLLVDHNEIWLFGDISTEVWYDAGNANFPFAAVQGAYISHGNASPSSQARLDNTVFWLGNDEFGDGIAYRANGYAPVRISTFAMEQAWQRYPTISDAVAWTYQQDGHSFYVLSFPSGDATWVFNAATGLWHQLEYMGTLALNDGQPHRSRLNTHAFAFGKHICGDWETGFLYQLTPLLFDDDGREALRLRSGPVIDEELQRVTHSLFQLDMEVGIGSTPVPPPGPPAPPSNASAFIVFPLSRPLGNPVNGALWNNWTVPTLPGDATITGIYPVVVAAMTADPTPAVEQYLKYGATVLGNAIPGQSFTGFPSPNHVTITATEFTAPSIGTSPTLLLSQAISAQLNESRLLDNLKATMTVTAMGYAFVYTSSNPIIDPQIPPPFAIPPGSGLAWALPQTVTTTQPSTQGLINITSSQAVIQPHTGTTWVTIATFGYTVVFGPVPEAGQEISIMNTLGSGAAMNAVNIIVNSSTGSSPEGSFTVLYPNMAASALMDEAGDGLTSSSGGSNTGACEASASIPAPVPPVIPPGPTDPLINLRWSDDGGWTWSNYHTISMGMIGQYRKLVRWWRLGYSRQRVYEVSTGQLRTGLNIYNAYIEAQVNKI